jgi:hypothetical protein
VAALGEQRDLGRQTQGFVVPRGVGGLLADVGDARQPAAPGAVLGLGRRRHAQARVAPRARNRMPAVRSMSTSRTAAWG